MIHLDLFSGIGGFAYAMDKVFDDVEHVFCEIDPFCQQVLKKHYPNSQIYADIRTLTHADWARNRTHGSSIDKRWPENFKEREDESQLEPSGHVDIITGGFPCQPFSQAGKRRGTEDNRYLWPEMFRIIQEFQPTWVVAENVRGLLTIEGGLVFEQVCLDLEGEGYEVQPIIIPACAVNAPHRRDRIWFVAYRNSQGHNRGSKIIGIQGRELDKEGKDGSLEPRSATTRCNEDSRDDTDTASNGFYGTKNREGGKKGNNRNPSRKDKLCKPGRGNSLRPETASWNQNWLEVATSLCGVDDGLPTELDGFELSKSKHRKERLKSLGNAIVPQVAVEIFKGIKSSITE
jgi:DNA (cytosine-5)-methyltransferase 1